jgi:hypothetical protein
MVGKYPKAQIAKIMGRGTPAVEVKAYELGFSLKMDRTLDAGADTSTSSM